MPKKSFSRNSERQSFNGLKQLDAVPGVAKLCPAEFFSHPRAGFANRAFFSPDFPDQITQLLLIGMNFIAQVAKKLTESIFRMMFDQIVDHFNCCNRTGEMIVKVEMQTLAAGRLLFFHKNLSHLVINEAVVRGGLADLELEGESGPSVCGVAESAIQRSRQPKTAAVNGPGRSTIRARRAN